MRCEDCIEWEYFDGYGYGCFCMKTMTPIIADNCKFYSARSKWNEIVQSTKDEVQLSQPMKKGEQ